MPDQFNVVDGLLWYFVFLYSTVLHEAAHAWAAFRLGDDTAYRGGQVTIDPTPHIRREPFGMVIVPIISWFLNHGTWMIGWASAPYDPTWAQRYPRRAALMAAAGPCANLALLLAAALLVRAGMEWNVFHVVPFSFSFFNLVEGDEGIWRFCAALLNVAFALNLIFLVFNLLPLPPLDGSALPLLVLSPRAAEKYQAFMWHPSIQLFGLIVAWQIFGNVFPRVARIALQLILPTI
jgi:Zn-dependent protease